MSTDLIWIPFLILLAVAICAIGGKRLNIDQNQAILLCIWHTAFCILYYIYSKNNVADSSVYYLKGELGTHNWSPGTNLVTAFSSVLVSVGMSYLATFLLFNLFGLMGLLALFHCLMAIWPRERNKFNIIPIVIVFMPGLSFWSSSLGKDAPAFMSVCLACFSSLRLGKRKTLAVIAVLLMFAVRPHIAAVMLAAFGFSVLSSSGGIRPSQRILLVGLGAVGSAFLVPFALNYAGLEGDLSGDAVAEYIEARQGYNLSGGSSINLKDMSVPVQVFSYLFRPLFIDANGVLALGASVENIVLLSITIRFLPTAVLYALRTSSVAVRYNLIYAAISIAILSTTTANLGIASRQKTMVLPALSILMAFGARAQAAHRQGIVRHIP